MTNKLIQGMFFQAPTEVENPENFPMLDEIRIKITKRGDGVAKLLVSSIDGKAKLKFVNGIGKFYTDQNATTEIGDSVTIAAGKTAFYAYAKVTDNGELSIENVSDLYSLGFAGSFNPIISFINDVDNTKPSFSGEIEAVEIGHLDQLRAINSANSWFAVTGNLSDLSGLIGLETLSVARANAFTSGDNSFMVNLPILRTFNLMSPVNLDMKYFPYTMTTLVTGAQVKTSYTGVGDRLFGTSDIMNIGSVTSLPASQVDNLLIAFSKQGWVSQKSITIKGSRTNASDEAMATLQGQGVTVTLV